MDTMRSHLVVCAMLLAALGGCASDDLLRPADGPEPVRKIIGQELPATAKDNEHIAENRAAIAKNLGPGVVGKDEVYTITVARDDLELMHPDFQQVPIAAGVESRFHFFPCPCGKTFVIGQFCVIDYEANDVIDELRPAHIQVVSMAPMLLGERPRLLIIRFQGEGDAGVLSAAIRTALRWTGKERLGK